VCWQEIPLRHIWNGVQSGGGVHCSFSLERTAHYSSAHLSCDVTVSQTAAANQQLVIHVLASDDVIARGGDVTGSPVHRGPPPPPAHVCSASLPTIS